MSRRIYYAFIVIYVFLVVFTNLLSFSFFGVRVFSLFSGSMGPAIPAGSLVVVKKSADDYLIGDVIAYYTKIDNQEVIVAHRIVGYGGNVYITKGDNNLTLDQFAVQPRLIIGRIVLNIPYLGYFFGLYDHPVGVYFVVFLPALFIIIIESIKIKHLLRHQKKHSHP